MLILHEKRVLYQEFCLRLSECRFSSKLCFKASYFKNRIIKFTHLARIHCTSILLLKRHFIASTSGCTHFLLRLKIAILAVNKVKVSAAQSFCKMIDCKYLVKPIQSWKHGEKDNFLMTTRWLSMNRAFIILNQILLSTKALNCNCQS